MEVLSINFTKEEITPFAIQEEQVPDALLIKAWFSSQISTSYNNSVQLKQWVRENKVKVGKEYKVKIQLKEKRNTQRAKCDTYEIKYYEGAVVRGCITTTFMEKRR